MVYIFTVLVFSVVFPVDELHLVNCPIWCDPVKCFERWPIPRRNVSFPRTILSEENMEIDGRKDGQKALVINAGKESINGRRA